MNVTPARSGRSEILGVNIDITSYRQAVGDICAWASRRLARYVCVTPVSSVMEAYDSPEFRQVMNQADLVTADGMPVVWSLRLLGFRNATRVYGPDLTLAILRKAAEDCIPVGFYGGSPATLNRLLQIVRLRHPGLNITFAVSPPFRALSEREDQAIVDEINISGAGILFVGLGSPRQECWMAVHKSRISAVMIGVGAAFDFLAGTKPQAPRWMMRIGMEWFFRLATEPRRLWKRYLKQNPRFVLLFILQLLRWKSARPQAATPLQ